MARRRASMREGPLAELFRATEAAQKQAEKGEAEAASPPEALEPQEETVRSSGRMCFHPQGEQDYSGDVTAGLPIVTSNHLAR